MRVLLVEDDRTLSELLLRVLREDGHEADYAPDLAQALRRTQEGRFDAIVLDWMLPDGDGIECANALRRRGDPTPILMLTARSELPDRIGGLRAGADDYMTKPFDVEELLVRLEALVRMSERLTTVVSGDLVLDRLDRKCRVRGVLLELTTREYDLLLRLAIANGAPVSRTELLADVWNLGFDPGSGVVDVQISRIREKLGQDAWRIETVRGAGYRLRSSL